MGTCIYCGKPAGLLRNKHKECAEKRDNGWAMMIKNVEDSILRAQSEDALKELLTSLNQIAKCSFIPFDQMREALIVGWGNTVNHFLEDGILDPQEELNLIMFAKYFGLTERDLDKNGAYSKFIKGKVLRELLNGKLPSPNIVDTLPFNFQKSETLVWVFNNVAYYEDKIRRQYVGGSHGVSVRIAKGVYYRVGSFKGTPVETIERVHVDTGILAVTTKHIYFHGQKKTFRVRLDKVVSFMPYSDGIGIQRDAMTAMPQFFITGDGWFIYNLVINMVKLL